MAKLNQMVAVRKGLRARTEAAVTKIYHDFQKPGLFNGLVKTYKPRDDEGEQFPRDYQRVQKTVVDELHTTAEKLTKLFDVAATIDQANQGTTGDVVVDGETLFSAPIPFLLFVDKQLEDLRTQVAKAPVLDPAEVWTNDPSVGGYRTQEAVTTRTRKVPKVLVKYEATPQHAAQTEVYTVDEVVGDWTTTKFSGAMPADQRRALLERINVMADAVKKAVEQANSVDVQQVQVGGRIFDYLLDY